MKNKLNKTNNTKNCAGAEASSACVVMPICEKCKYWKKDYGIRCFNGWTGTEKNDGHCHYEPKIIYKKADDFCARFESA